MGLELNLDYGQSNDALTLVLQDSAGAYNAVSNTVGWGTPNVQLSEIVATTDETTNPGYHLTLTISIIKSSGSAVVYDEIDLYDFAPFSTTADLVFPITADILKVNGTAIGDSATKVPDGIWSLTYQIEENNATPAFLDTHTDTILVDGSVEISLMDKLNEITQVYDHTDFDNINYDIRSNITDTLYMFSYLQGIRATAYSSKTEELQAKLYTLESLLAS